MVMRHLDIPNPHQLVWQSKVGPLPWLAPFTDEAIKGFMDQGERKFLMVPIAFVNEHIETLHEMDIEYCEELNNKVPNSIKRVPAPNDHPDFINALADVVKSHIDSNMRASPKFWRRCPHCTNETCLKMKTWFNRITV